MTRPLLILLMVGVMAGCSKKPQTFPDQADIEDIRVYDVALSTAQIRRCSEEKKKLKMHTVLGSTWTIVYFMPKDKNREIIVDGSPFQEGSK